MYKAILVIVAAASLAVFAAGAKESGTAAVQKNVSKMEQALDAAK